MCGRKSGRFSRPTARGQAKALVALSLVLCLGLSPLMAWPQPSKPSKEQVQVQESRPQEVRLSPVVTQVAETPLVVTPQPMQEQSTTDAQQNYYVMPPDLLTDLRNQTRIDSVNLTSLQNKVAELSSTIDVKDAQYDDLLASKAELQGEYDALAGDYADLANAPKANTHKTTIMPKAAYRVNDGAWGVGVDLTHRIGYVSLGVGATYFPTDGLDKTIVTGGVGVSF